MPAFPSSRDYARIERAIGYLIAHHCEQPTLRDIARVIHLSPYHFQRLFTRWAGVSPKQFLRFVTVEHAKQALVASQDLLQTSLESGLSGPGRLHDLFVTYEAVTPGEYKALGDGLVIRYGFHDGPFGRFIVALTERGICWLSFIDADDEARALDRLGMAWPGAVLVEAADETGQHCAQLFASADRDPRRPLKLWLKGTNFQIKVWTALLGLPSGRLTSYRALADAIGTPGATRAVGQALAANPVACLIPCHRVIRAAAGLETGYRWGAARKWAMIGREAAQAGAPAD